MIDKTEYQALANHARKQMGDSLRALILFGSCLSAPRGVHRGVPDLLAILDDGSLDSTLRAMDCGWLTRLLSSRLPPLTLALRRSESPTTVAKLNLIEGATAQSQISKLPDLYLAGRLSKRTALIYARDRECAAQIEALSAAAARAIAELVVLDLPRSCLIVDAVRACIGLSYRAEIRPEGPHKIEALYQSFASDYQDRFGPLIIQAAMARGQRFAEDPARILDDRSEVLRKIDRQTLLALLGRSRRRAMLRWPKQVLVYRGWMTYVLEKRRRSHQQEKRLCPLP